MADKKKQSEQADEKMIPEKDMSKEKNDTHLKVISGVLMLTVFLAGIWYIARDNNPRQEKTNQEVIEVQLPSTWSESENTPEGLIAQVEKQADSFKPTAIVSKTEVEEPIENPESYVDTVILGAQSAIPSLEMISEDTEETEEYYIKNLTMQYVEGNNIVISQQRLFIKGNEVHSIAASYLSSDEESKSEIGRAHV